VKPVRGTSGATLVELLLALVLLGVVTAGVYGMVSWASGTARRANAFLLSQAQVRAGLDNVVDEARWGSRVNVARPTCVTVRVPRETPFSQRSPYSVSFWFDPAGRVAMRRQSLNPDALDCPVEGPGGPLAHGVVRLGFEYFDASGVSLGTGPVSTDRISRVRVVVTTELDGVRRTFAGDVALRAR